MNQRKTTGDLRGRWLAPLAVDVATVAKRDDDNQEHVVGDGVDDAVVPDTDAKGGSSLQGAGARRTRVLCQQGDGASDARTNLWIELAQGSGRGGAKLDAVLVHVQPRSALTWVHGMFGPSSFIAASKAATSSASSSAAISC